MVLHLKQPHYINKEILQLPAFPNLQPTNPEQPLAFAFSPIILLLVQLDVDKEFHHRVKLEFFS